MNHDSNKDTEQVLIVAACITGVGLAVYIFFMALPLLICSVFFGYVLVWLSWNGSSYQLSNRLIQTVSIGLLVSLILLGFPGVTLFKGIMFDQALDFTKTMVANYVYLTKKILPKFMTIKAVGEGGLRIYLWLLWPLSLAMLAVHWVLRRSPPALLPSIKANDTKTSDLLVGYFSDQGSLPKKCELSDQTLKHHVHIIGASGFGKSVLLFHIVADRIRKNRGLMFVDLKADRETIRQVVSICTETNQLEKLKFFSCANPEFSSYYNILSNGNATELRDRIIKSFNWSEVFYKDQCSGVLLKILIALVWVRENQGETFHLGDIERLLTLPDAVAELKTKIPEGQISLHQHLDEIYKFLRDKDRYNFLQGLRTQLQSILLSEFGHKLCPPKDVGSENVIDIFSAVQKSEVIYFLLDSRRYSESAISLGKMILEDLKAASAKIDAEVTANERKPFNVIIDEFADLASNEFISFLDRARSSGMGTVLAHQEISDLKKVSPETASRLMHLSSTTIVFLSKISDSAEMIAATAGTRAATKATYRGSTILGMQVRSNDVSIREVEEFKIHPNQLKSLKIGEAVIIGKYPTAFSGIVKILPPAKIQLSDQEFEIFLKNRMLELEPTAKVESRAESDSIKENWI